MYKYHISLSFLCVFHQKATLGLNRFYEASSIPVARHLSASRFQWQLLGGLMNSTGHSVCPHITPDWISVLCWLKAKLSLLPFFEIYIQTLYPSLQEHFNMWSEKCFEKGCNCGALWNINGQVCLSKLTLISRLGLCLEHNGVECTSNVMLYLFKRGELVSSNQWERNSGEKHSTKWMWCLNAKMFVRRRELFL